jgi:hypothetical protein
MNTLCSKSISVRERQGNRSRKLFCALALVMVFGAVGCGKKKVKNDVPPPPSPAPSASFSVEPSTIERGQSTQLTWQTDNATEVEIEGIGASSTSGPQTVTPETSTTYRLIAKGPGGQREAATRVTVSQPMAAEVASNGR